MPHDFLQLLQALGKGLVIGLVVFASIIAWRWLRGEALLLNGRKKRVHELPIGLWIFSFLFCSGLSAMSFISRSPSFGGFFALAALLYLSRLVYSLIVRRRVGLSR